MFNCSGVTIIGGGNIGTQFACKCASKGYKVNVFSSQPEKFCKTLTIVDADDNVTCQGKINIATSDIKEAIDDNNVVFVIHPAFMFLQDADMLAPFVKPGMYIVVVPGTGGAEFAFKKCIEKGATLLGIQRVPSVARIVEYGKTVRCEGYRDKLHIASVPADGLAEVSDFISDIFDMPCVSLKNYLSVTMTPSNPILHTTRLATLFEDYTEGKVYDKNPLFYGEWSLKSSQLLLECDKEHQKMLSMLNKLDLSDVRSLAEHYDNSDTPEKLTKKIQSIKSLHNLTSPMKKVKQGWEPDFGSRYFTADFPYGLAIIEQIADLAGAEIPNIRKTMNWYRKVTGDMSKLDLKKYGIYNLDNLYELYE